MLEEMRELEQEHAHEGILVAKEKLKNFLFRYRINHRLQRLKDQNKVDSYEYAKAVIEIQTSIKYESEQLIALHCGKYQKQTAEYKAQLEKALDDMWEVKFNSENERRLNRLLNGQIQDSNTQVELARSNVAYLRERQRETESKLEGLALENSKLKDLANAFDSKNKQLTLRIEKLMKEEGRASITDYKLPFDKHDRDIERGRLLQEIQEVRESELLALRKPPKQTFSQQVCTEIRNVQKDIVYRNEHGDGVLKHQETQSEHHVIRLESKEGQTDNDMLQLLVQPLVELEISKLRQSWLETSNRDEQQTADASGIPSI